MKTILSLSVLLICSLLLHSQSKELTMNDAVIGQWRNLYPEYIQQIQWQNNTNYTYIKSKAVIQGNIKSKNEKTLFELTDINSALKEKNIKEVSYISNYKWIDENIFQFYSNNNLIQYNIKDKKTDLIIELSEDVENTDYCKENKTIAYTVDNNLYLALANNKSMIITNDKDKSIVNGQTVHRNEFGISKGTFWSPKGNYLAFYKKDESNVTDYPLVDMTKRIAELKNIKYPMAGMKSEHVRLCIYNIETKNTTIIETGEPKEQYLTNISWGPEEKFIYISVLNRDQNHLKLNKYDIATGKYICTVYEEKNERYVEPEHPIIFVPGKNDQFILQSEKDGWNHLYLYDISGKEIKQITKGEWVVTEVIGFNKAGNELFFTSTQESPIENHAYKVNFDDYKITKLTSDKGSHNLILSSDGDYLIDSYSNTDIPKKYDIIDANGKLIKNLLTAKNPLTEYKLGEMTIGKIKAGDSETDLYYRLIKPADFDPNKKYPAIIYVYGGPHAQLITESWLGGVRMWQYYMAQLGYVMLTIDNRGSANRGFKFESVIHRNIGIAEIEDQMEGVKFLENLGYVDMKRIGVHGWSYGGFMTTSLMLKHSDKFKVGVAGGPVMDWKYYEVMYGERYMDTPEDNPDGYKNACLTEITDKLEGKLLIIQGYIDNTVVPQHSLDFIENCIKNNKQVDFFLYPTAEHNVSGYDRVHLMQKITNYFEDYLK